MPPKLIWGHFNTAIFSELAAFIKTILNYES